MTYTGYLQKAGVEIINVARTKAYVENQFPAFPLTAKTEVPDDLRLALGDEAYESPMLDDAPWYDPARPATARFFGAWPLEFEGFDGSTRTGTVTESIGDGGFVSGIRRKTRQMRVRVVLVGQDSDALQEGMSWLDAALEAAACAGCGGDTVCFYAAEPKVDPMCPSPGGFGFGQETGPVAVGKPIILPIPQAPGLYHNYWVLPISEGTVFRFGTYPGIGTQETLRRGPYASRRTNYLLNADFNNSGAHWTLGGGHTFPAAGGADGKRYLSMVEGPSTFSYNYVPNGDLAIPLDDSGWTTNSGSGITRVSGRPGTETPSGFVARIDQRGDQADLWVTIPLVNVVAPGDGEVFVQVWTWDEGVVEYLGPDDTVLGSAPLVGGEVAWQNVRISPVPIQAGGKIRISTTGMATDSVYVQQVAAGVPSAEFWGDTPITDPGFLFSWVNGDPNQGAQVEVLPYSAYSAVSDAMTLPFQDIRGSVALRSRAVQQNVSLRLRDADTNAILADVTVQPTGQWQRFSVGYQYGGRVKLSVQSSYPIDIDQAQVEIGTADLPFAFSSTAMLPPVVGGDTADYTYVWLGTPEESPAQITWKGDTNDFQTPDAGHVFANIGEQCGDDWRPWIETLAGGFSETTYITSGQFFVPGPEQGEVWERSFHDVTVIDGPTVVKEYALSQGAAMEVEFTLVAATPFIYSATNDIAKFDRLADLQSTTWDDRGWLESVNEMRDPSVGAAANFAASVAGGAATISRYTGLSINQGLPQFFQGAFAQATCTTAGTYIDVRNQRTVLPVTPGLQMSFSVYAAASAVIAGAVTQMYVQFYDGSGTVTGTTGPVVGTPISNTTFTKYKLENATVPAGSVGASIIVRVVASIPVGYWVQATAFQANIGATVSRTASGAFVDPSGAEVFYWDAAANSSRSRRLKSFQCAPDPSENPIVDPSLPQPPAKPSAPQIVDPNTALPTQWTRYYYLIDAEDVSAWNQTIPTITLISKSAEARKIRVRFTPNPFGYDVATLDPCSYCSEFVLSYLPKSTEVTIDGVVQRATASVNGAGEQPASNLLFSSDGGPMTWPSLSCGVPYAMTIDVPTDAPADLELSMSLTRQE